MYLPVLFIYYYYFINYMHLPVLSFRGRRPPSFIQRIEIEINQVSATLPNSTTNPSSTSISTGIEAKVTAKFFGWALRYISPVAAVIIPRVVASTNRTVNTVGDNTTPERKSNHRAIPKTAPGNMDSNLMVNVNHNSLYIWFRVINSIA